MMHQTQAKPAPVDFLLARIAELEDDAGELGATYGQKWLDTGDLIIDRHVIPVPDSNMSAHMATWDPAAALAWCTAAREIAEYAQDIRDEDDPLLQTDPAAAELAKGLRLASNLAVVALCRPFAEHPDYNPDWERCA